MKTIALAAGALSAALVLGACEKEFEAPLDKGVCYHLAFDKDGKARFNRVAENMPNIENCAAQLEGMRLRFAHMGSYQNSMMGSYQGNFIFIERQGIFVGQHFNGMRYLALVRTGDGRLVQPGSMPNY